MKAYINGQYINVDVAERVPSAEELQKQKLTEIEQIKKQLTKLDYKTIKRMQGKLSDEEWEETCKICDELRNRINELENELIKNEINNI